MRVLIILFALLALTACGQKSGKVKFELTSSFGASGPVALGPQVDGGLMVWGISNKGDSFSRVLTSSSNIELEIPNGLWTFTAVAWESGATGSPALVEFDNEGLRCARSAPMDLKGDDVRVNLDMTTAKCDHPSFRGGGTDQASVKLSFCQNAQAVDSINDTCTNDPDPGVGGVSDKAPVRSVRLRMMEYDKFGRSVVATGPGISRCINLPNTASGLWVTPNDFAIPVGDPAKPAENPFRMEIEFHWNTIGCNGLGDLDYGVTQLPLGLVSPEHKFFVDGSSNHVGYINVDDRLLCKGRESATTFDIGDGTQDHPWVICSVAQLHKIHDDRTESYRLAADIDLNESTKGLAGAILPSFEMANDCWELGQTWQPLGLTDASCSSPTVAPFTGSFYGGGHTIKNLRTRYKETDDVGFIARWSPVTNQTIRELKLESLEVEGRVRVGGVIGNKPVGMLAFVHNIVVDNGKIEASNNGTDSLAGGVFGYVGDTDLRRIRTTNVSVQGDMSRIGGVAGQISLSNGTADLAQVKNIYSHAHVFARGGTYHGGVAGFFQSGANMGSQIGLNYGAIRHEGVIRSSGTHVGGLFGLGHLNTFSTSYLSDVYATSVIYNESMSDPWVGGLIGESNIMVFNRAYFAGEIVIKDTVGGKYGFIVGEAATSIGGVNVRYLDSNNQALNFFGDGNYTALTATQNAGSNTNDSSGDFFVANGLAGFNDGVVWEHTSGGLPRFVDEDHPCADATNLLPLASQTGRGRVANPFAICHKDQLAAVGGLTAGNVRLLAPINLTGAFTPPAIAAAVTVDGADQVLFGYKSGIAATTAGDRAPFSSIAGTLKNVKLANMSVTMTASTGPSTVSGLATTNSGVIDGVDYLSGDISHQDPSTTFVAGLVNTNTGAIRNVRFYATVGGHGSISGLVNENSGTIEDSVVGGTLYRPGGAAAMNSVAGIAALNHATIQRVRVESRFELNSSVSNLSMGVVRNNPNGVLRDISIDPQAEWMVTNFGGSTAAIVSRNFGVVERGLMRGRMLSTDLSSATITDTYLGRTVVNMTLNGNTGSYGGVYTQSPAGRMIFAGNDTDVSCSSNDLSITPGLAGDFAFGVGYWDSNLVANQKYVWVIGENDGDVFAMRAIGSVDGSSIQLHLNAACAAFLISGTKITVVQSFADDAAFALDSLNSGNFSGVADVSFVLDDTNLGLPGSPWLGNVLDSSDSNDLTLMLDYFFDLQAGLAPIRPAPWEREDSGQLGLFGSN
jgi:hypothetical protein